MTAEVARDARIPVWDTADRMRKALREAGIGVEDMAEYLGVTRQSVGSWLGGRYNPSLQTMRLWAIRTGVPFEWLTAEWYTARDSNPEPAGYSPVVASAPAGVVSLAAWRTRRASLVDGATTGTEWCPSCAAEVEGD